MIIKDDAGLKKVLSECKSIAAVGCSANEEKPTNYVPRKLQKGGFKLIPINPQEKEILGETCYAALKDVPEKVDIVLCFRRAELIPEIVEDAIAIGAKVVWMPKGIVNEEAAKRASDAGLDVVMDHCPAEELKRLYPERAE